MRSISVISLFAAMALAAPAAMAGDIVKCVDADGRVTLTDQPCAGGSAGVRLTPASMPDADVAPARTAPVAQRRVLPAADLRQGGWRKPDLSRAIPLRQDVATLQAARRMMMLQDARPTLAGLP